MSTLRLGLRDHEEKGSTVFQNTLTTTHPVTEHHIPEGLNIQQTAVTASNLANKPYNSMTAS